MALTRQTFVGKVMSLLFNMLSRLVITFLPRSKGLLISWLQSQSAVILEPLKIKSGDGNGTPLQYSGLENSMDYIVYRVAKSYTRLIDFHFTYYSWGRIPRRGGHYD